MTTLKDLYIDELQDLWSANAQMSDVVSSLIAKASDVRLADRLTAAREGVDQHSDLLKGLIDEAGGETKKEHCKGMEEDLDGAALDVSIIAQYQRMCHYGIAGFGTAKAYAEALGETEAADRLDDALDNIYESDDFMTELAERSRNLKSIG